MEIIEFKKEYIDQVVQIENDSFDHPFPRDFFLNEKVNNPYSRFLLLVDNNEVLAYIDYWITFDSSTLAKIAVSKKHLRKGYASKLMDFMVFDLESNNVDTCTLEVRVSNIPAISLYLKYDFVKITIKEKYYDDGEDAIYMVKGV